MTFVLSRPGSVGCGTSGLTPPQITVHGVASNEPALLEYGASVNNLAAVRYLGGFWALACPGESLSINSIARRYPCSVGAVDVAC
jgi:hypothetical protein